MEPKNSTLRSVRFQGRKDVEVRHLFVPQLVLTGRQNSQLRASHDSRRSLSSTSEGLFNFSGADLAPYALPKLRPASSTLPRSKKRGGASPAASGGGGGGGDSGGVLNGGSAQLAAAAQPASPSRSVVPRKPASKRPSMLSSVRRAFMPAQTDEEFDEAEQQLQRTETEEQSDSKEQDAETAAASAAAHLQSGEDVIAFFARHGEASPIKFVHLNRADTGDIFRPYDLVVVDQDKVQPEHFTMSAKGVVHVCPNQPSEFVPLSEWMRESTLFNVLTSMKFFKYYLVGNTFRTWCNNVKFNLYCVKRNVLSRRLFAAKQSFCLPVMEINNLLAELESVKFLSTSSQRYEITSFTEAQAECRSQASKVMEAQLLKVQHVVERVCADVSRRAHLPPPSDEAPSEKDKSKSMLAIKQERDKKMRALRLAAAEEAMLGSFVRMVDYMCVERLANIVIEQIEGFLQDLVDPGQHRKSGMFQTMVRFSETGTVFEPSLGDFEEMVQTTAEAMIATATSGLRLLYARSFKAYVAELPIDGSAPAAPSVSSLVKHSPRFSGAISGLLNEFANSFESAEDYATTFENVRCVYDFQREFDPQAHRAKRHTVNSIKKDLKQMREWQKRVDTMRVQNPDGSLYVDSKVLKGELQPIVESALDTFKGLLVELASSKTKDMVTSYTTRTKTLELQPGTLKDFAVHLEKLKKLKADDRTLTEQVQVIEEMFRLLEAYEVRINNEDAVQLDMMRQKQSEYADALVSSDDFVEDRLPEMRGTLEMNISRLNDQLRNTATSMNEGMYIDTTSDAAQVLESLEQVKHKLAGLDELSKTYSKWRVLLQSGVTSEFDELKQAHEAYKQRHLLWTSVHKFSTQYKAWTTDPFKTVDVEELNRDVGLLMKTAFVCDKKLQDPVSAKLKEEVSHFKHLTPMILDLGNRAMKERHWQKLYAELGQTWIPGNETFTLHELMGYDVFAHKDMIGEISGTASGESQLEDSLQKVEDGWREMQFVTKKHREQKNVFILGGLDDIFTLLEDNQVTLQTMMGSRYIRGVQDEVESWEKKLSLLSDTLDEWVNCQRNWMYLETIFSAEDIQRQLPAEATKFTQVDKKWREAMLRTHKNPVVIAAVENGDELLKTFQHCNVLLEEIQKSLEDYLETKRAAFPRFYFLSNDELLQILSQTRDPRAVQPHLRKCFDNVAKLRFGEDEHETDMYTMVSGEDEHVEFSEAVSAAGNVENWLGDVERMMQKTLYDMTKASLKVYPESEEEQIERADWMFSMPAQPILTVDQIMWTAGCTRAIEAVAGGNKAALKEFLQFNIQQIGVMVRLVRGELSKQQRTLMGALVVLDVHGRDVIAAMARKGVGSLNDFEWTRQLRYYWDEKIDNCVVRQTNTRFVYGYEYLGNNSRLVITPLTDKCYMTLTGALHLKFGGAPAGPAGTGKTETTKDLGKALAYQCVVFNCSDGLDYKMMGRFFAGLAQAGAWACFDEFNRIDIEVLSVIAQQILCIQQGLMTNAATIEFEGREISLNAKFGVFITMNPGYAGRTELPDNLKALFRPVAMMVPDYRLIAEIILFSQGFQDASNLSNKMAQLYKLASEQLSKQDHYDFGMRAVKSVLVAAGQLKRKEPDVDENLLLIRAMRDSNVPKFLEHDLPLFRGILADLFPGVDVPFVDYGELQQAIEHQLDVHGLQRVPNFITKVIQVHETQLVRHGMMIVGEAGSGKSTNAMILAKALSQLKLDGVVDKDGFYQLCLRYIMNPKAVTMGELYGEFNQITNEWTDGLVANLVRQTVADSTERRKWIIFDGPVDALWIENMNTVLDDNKTLCLANGERIKLPNTLHMMFEVRDLAVASPATVSRCGMVYMEPVHVGVMPIVETWSHGEINVFIPEEVPRIKELIEEHLQPTLDFLREHCHEVVPSQDQNLVQSFLALLSTLLRPEKGVRGSGYKKVYDPPVIPDPSEARTKKSGGAEHEDGEEGEDGEGQSEPGAEESKAATATESPEGQEAEEQAAEDTAGDEEAAEEAGEEAPAAEGDATDELADIEIDADLAAELDAAGGDGEQRAAGQLSPDELADAVNLAYCFAFVWSFGCNVHDSSREKFNEFANATLASLLPPEVAGTNLFSYMIDTHKRKLIPWEDRMRPFEYLPSMPYFSIVVPTIDTTRYAFLLEQLLQYGRNVLFTGDTGVGKSIIVQDTINRLCIADDPGFVSGNVNFSAQTTSANLQEGLEASLDKKRKNLLGPPAGKRMAVFIDDLNMPALEEYGAQPPIELLRQVIDQKGFFDRQKLFFKHVDKTLFVAACAPPGGGRNEVTPRLTRHFHMIWLTALSSASMKRIFGTILRGFVTHQAPTLVDRVDSVVDAAVTLYRRVEDEMLPTPTKSHYTFNLRDLGKVFQGMLMSSAAALPDCDALVRLWLHEEQRVFRDRLINYEDADWFDKACSDMLKQYLDVEWPVDQFRDLLFGHYMTRDDRKYTEIAAPEKLPDVFSEYLEEYNVTFPAQMHLVFFQDAISHLSRISRILAQPRGSALLVGVGGSGRQSLTRLASFVADYECCSIEITRIYGVNEWHDDLKSMLMKAGIEGKNTVFLFSDTQIVRESFLEDINNILNSGDVPNLYAPDELEQIVNGVRPHAKDAGVVETRDALMAFYIQRVRDYLHIALAFSPIGAAFRNRCRQFPSLVNCCTIDWFSAWPKDALFSVAKHFLSKATSLGIEELVDPLCGMCVKIHQSVETVSERFLAQFRRHNYTTPTSYLELIKLYLSMLEEQRDVVAGKISRYRGGLQKLKETNEMVAGLREKLTQLQPTLKKAQEDTTALLKQLEVDQKEADEAAAVAATDEADAAQVAKEVQVMKDDCQRDLDKALPAYRSALKALDSLDKKQIQEVKSFAKPPQLVGVVLEAVCLLLGRKTTWDEAKKLMNDIRFIDILKSYDKDNIDPKIIKKLKKYINQEDFNPTRVQAVSQAATSLCMWVLAMNTYDEVAKGIAPKKAALAEATGKLDATNKVLAEKRSALAKIQAQVAELQARYQASMAKKQDLEQQSEQTTQRLGRAQKLIGGLGSEAERWSSTAAQLEDDKINLVGNVMLAAGSVAYIGPFTAALRTELISDWVKDCHKQNIPVDPGFSLTRILADPVEVREWNIMGLPADDFSTQNGLFATRGRRWPLMIDPQSQANRWIKNMQKESGLQIIKLSEPDFLRTLENAIRFGQPVLLENVEEELDPALEPVLLKQVFKRGGQMLLRLGDSDVPYSDEFKLYITTKLANPHYMPEVCIKVTIINFTVTLKGLEDQLLVDVVRYERPDLEQKKDQLIISIASDKKQLKDIEDKILQMLADSTGDILDDEELIESLAQSQTTSTAISTRMKEAELTTKEINEARELYRPVATRSSVLYFVIADLANVDPMYQYSLQAFTRLYNLRIERSEKSEDLAERLKILISDLTESFYVNVCRGLFEKDKLLYSFLIAVQVLRNSNVISAAEWQAFLVGVEVKEEDLPPIPDACKKWMQPKPWGMVVGLSTLPGFGDLQREITAHPDHWKLLATSKTPQSEKLPGDWDTKLTPFQRLLVLKAFREEKTVFAVREFVGQELGALFTEPPPFDLNGTYKDSSAQIPLIFVLSPGADPIDYLLKLAKEKGKGGPGLKIISLGQGQGPIAESMMEAARRSGDWVCLQNCHLAVSWLPRLEQILEQTMGTDEHPDYRLWLTSMPTQKFPVPILQNGIKLTQEPPRGLKANLKRTFMDMTEKEFEGCTKPHAFKKLLFGLGFYHALILERRKFGAIGWNIPYEWMNSDLKTGIMQLRMYLEEQSDVPYETLNAVVGDITYGGRATDAWDKRTNLSILRTFFCPEVLDDSYRFSESGLYYSPPEGDLASVLAYIEGLPLDDAPETFGLHENADITLQQKQTNELLETTISIQPRLSGGTGGKSPDEQVTELAEEILAKLPEQFSKRDAHPATFATIHDGSVNSMGVFAEQEMVRFNKLIAVMSKSLDELKKAIKGLVVMSPQLETMHSCFLYKRVPPDWETAAYPSLKPLGSWVEDLFQRLHVLDLWIKHGPPSAYWISGFFFPQGFMTGALQTHSRKTKIAIDTLGFRTDVTSFYQSDVTGPPTNGVYIYGLFLQGARWSIDNKSLEESKPGELFCPVPCIWLEPLLLKDMGEATDVYYCPVYKTSQRAGTLSTTGHSTNFIVTLHLPSKQPEDHWIRRGVAMLSQLDD